MKRIVLGILFGVLFLTANRCQAVVEFGLDRTTLELKHNEATGNKQVVTVDSYGQWEWFELDLRNKFNYPCEVDDGHSVGIRLGLPQLAPSLGLDFDYTWDPKYCTAVFGVEHHWKPFKGFNSHFGLKTGAKSVTAGHDDRYRNSWNAQMFNFGYNKNDWSYRWKINRIEKDYPDQRSDYYTSEKYELEQKLSKDLTPAWELELTYKEDTGDYPLDTSMKRDYWKNEWSLQAKYKQKRNQRWTWGYQDFVWDNGLGPYQNKRFWTLEYNEWDKKHKLNMQFSCSEIEYMSQIAFDDPDAETIDEIEDTKSRFEQKISCEYTWYFKEINFGVELFAVNKDYKADTRDVRSCGLSTTFLWERRQYKLKLKLAPFGNTQSENAVYQVKLEYNPKDVIE